MLKTNSKQARENIKAYVMHHINFEAYEMEDPKTFKEAANRIMETFYDEKCKYDKRYHMGRISEWELFKDWCQGLPTLLDTCYYYNRSAVDDLGDILEETEEEKTRFTEEAAEERLTYLIYRELKKGVK